MYLPPCNLESQFVFLQKMVHLVLKWLKKSLSVYLQSDWMGQIDMSALLCDVAFVASARLLAVCQGVNADRYSISFCGQHAIARGAPQGLGCDMHAVYRLCARSTHRLHTQ